jgi:[NiFe] hydrogenase assembly HybE family chaperone
MPVFVPGFTLFEGQWIGCVLTPWMLSLAIFPGPEQCLADAKSGEKIGLQLPFGEMMFTVGELDGISQYCACSLMSPLAHDLSVEQGKRWPRTACGWCFRCRCVIRSSAAEPCLLALKAASMHELSLCQNLVEILNNRLSSMGQSG